MRQMITILLIGMIPLKAQAGITMSNVLEFIFDQSEIGKLEQAELSLSEDGSAWGMKFKQAQTTDDQKNEEIWRIGIYFEGNFRLLKNKFTIPSNAKHKDACLQGPIISPNGKRWGLTYRKRSEGGDCEIPKKDSCDVLINLETFGPFYNCGQLKFSATDNFSFIAQKTSDENKQLYSRIIRKLIINKKDKPIDTFIQLNDGSELPKIVYSPDGNHWLLGACTAANYYCYVQEKGNNTAKGPYQTISNIYYWGDWDKPDNRAWAIIYFKGNEDKVLVNTEKEPLPPYDQIKVLKFAHSQHQAKAWGMIYEDKLSDNKNSFYINDAVWPDKQIPIYSNLDDLTFAPNGRFLAFSYQKTKRTNWQTDIYSLENGQLKKYLTAEPCGEVECDFSTIEQLTISDDPEQFWGYVGADSNGKQYLVMYENKSHFQTLGPFNDIEGFYITPDGYSWGMRYTSSYDSGYYIYDRYAGLSKYEGISSRSSSELYFSINDNKPLWGFVYKGRKSHKENTNQYYVIINGTKITSREGKRGGFNHASIALLKKDGKKEIFSLVYLDKVTNKNRQIYRIRVNEIKQPYILAPIEPAWATSHTPNVGYQKVLQIGEQDFCKESSEPAEIERVCIKGLKSSKIAALRLFFKRLGLERGKTDLEIHQCDDTLKCRKPIISASKLIEFLEEKEGITNYSVNKSNFWLDIPVRGLPIQIRYEVKGDFELLGHSRLEYPFGYEITRIEYMPVEVKN
ncbi:hypothetical protein PN36_07280 [Candidatus Thiomargarita nelsonii]|uniref:Uncharacterized protein n=1 Tax=Candidatus Thiomargarita nelsonii TaxID=1003181 RepID=A0A4E0QWL4_9GAMM|nr:hypothetical protein PN36_07280 [Candidatus Thiomargarita nelsonii]